MGNRPGVAAETATALLAEIGPNMEAFPDQYHLVSWAGLCPGSHESAGKKKSSRITPAINPLKRHWWKQPGRPVIPKTVF